MDKLRLRVLDAHALGDPGFLGEAALDLRPLQLQPNAPPVNIWLPLQVRSSAVIRLHGCSTDPKKGALQHRTAASSDAQPWQA